MPATPPKSPVVTPKGQRYPGSGRKKGTPNRVSVEARVLVAQLVNDPVYQFKLRADFKRRKLHPTIESLIWQYHIGKPVLPVAIQGNLAVDVNARLEHEREMFAALDLADLEQLAAESQALVDRAQALAKVRLEAGTLPVNTPTPQDIVVESDGSKDPSKSLANTLGSDNEYFVNLSQDPEKNESPQ